VAKAPLGSRIEWDAEITEDRPNHLIAWKSARWANVHHSGSVRFEPTPDGLGTVVHVEVDYTPPKGRFGAQIARAFSVAPEQEVNIDLNRFKQAMETAVAPQPQSQPAGQAIFPM
jgi:uncharacterized membrane protein